MAFLSKKYKLKSYQERACSFTKKNKKVLLALPTGSGKTLASLYSIFSTLGEDFKLLFITEKVAIDDVIEGMNTFFSKGTFRPESTIGCNFPAREYFYSDLVDGTLNSIVTTYAIMRNDKDYLITLFKYFKSQGVKIAIVLDEATQVKNEESQNHKIAKELCKLSEIAIALTATPISKKLNDIDNIIRCIDSKQYVTRDRFKQRFEINTFETEGFLFKIKSSKLFINSNDDAVPDKVLKGGKLYFRIPWVLQKNTTPKTIEIHTKRKQTIPVKANENVYIPALINRDADFIGDITPYIKYDKESNRYYLYVPIVRCVNDDVVRFKSVGFTLISQHNSSREMIESNHQIIFSYDIGGQLIGYKNLSEYTEITKDVLFSLNKNEVGEIPPYVLYKRYYKTDSKTKKAVRSVYENSKGATTSVARVITASSAPSYILGEETKHINNKTQLLIDDLKSELSEESIIVYSPWVNVLNYISDILNSKGIEHCVYHGKISDDEKKRNKIDFKSGKKKIVLASNAASKGVNFQIAKTVIMFDISFTAENFQQVAGRIGRLGSIHSSLNIISYLAESDDAIENCLYRNVMGQMNFIRKVDINLVDLNLIDKQVTDMIDPEDSDRYILNSLGHSRNYYCGN